MSQDCDLTRCESRENDACAVHVSKLDWVECDDIEQIREFSADVLVGADVIYDPEIIPPLLKVVRMFFDVNPKLSAMFVVTKRNERTFKLFMHECRSQGISSRCITDEIEAHPSFYSVVDRESILVYELSNEERNNG